MTLDADRTCKVCGATYPKGTYRQHVDVAEHSYWAEYKANVRKRMHRDAELVAMMQANPNLTLQAVGDHFGITRERARQIWKRATGTSSTERRGPKTYTCRTCGMEYTGARAQHYIDANHRPNERQYVRNHEIVELYEDGLSSNQIGRIYNIGPSYVGAILRRHGVTARPLKGGTLVRRKDVYGD